MNKLKIEKYLNFFRIANQCMYYFWHLNVVRTIPNYTWSFL